MYLIIILIGDHMLMIPRVYNNIIGAAATGLAGHACMHVCS